MTTPDPTDRLREAIDQYGLHRDAGFVSAAMEWADTMAKDAEAALAAPAPDLLTAVEALIAAATAPGVTATPEALLNLGDAVIRVRFLIESRSVPTSREAYAAREGSDD